MEVFLYIIALLLALLGVIGAFLPILPGPLLSIAALVVGFFCYDGLLTQTQLLIWVGATAVIMVLDVLLPIIMAKRVGGSKSGIWGATIGMVVGLVAFPPYGILIGPFVGAVMGEMMSNKDDVGRALKVGFGTFVAFIFGTWLKFVSAMWILWILILAIYPAVESYFAELFDKFA